VQLQASLKSELKSNSELQCAMEVVRADLEVAHAAVARLEQAGAHASSTTQAELTKQLEANAALQEQYKEAEQQVTTLESQQVALEEACKQHKDEARFPQHIHR
jgi:Zn-dependent M32 family carboxypeptidase